MVLFKETADPAEWYLEFRDAVLGLGKALGGGVWDIEALLWLFVPRSRQSRRTDLGRHPPSHPGRL